MDSACSAALAFHFAPNTSCTLIVSFKNKGITERNLKAVGTGCAAFAYSQVILVVPAINSSWGHSQPWESGIPGLAWGED